METFDRFASVVQFSTPSLAFAPRNQPFRRSHASPGGSSAGGGDGSGKPPSPFAPFSKKDAALLEELRPWAEDLVRKTPIPKRDVEDVVQVAFAEAAARWTNFRPPRHLPKHIARRRWLATFLFLVAKNFRRSAQKRQFLIHNFLQACLPQGEPPSPENATLAHEVLQTFEHCTTPERWRAWVMREIDGMDIQEIARQEGTNVNSIFTRLYLARRDFAKAAARETAQSQGPLVVRFPRRK